MSSETDTFEFVVLICDADEQTAETLRTSLIKIDGVRSVTINGDLSPLDLDEVPANVIFIDPLSLGLTRSSTWILDVRRTYPEIAFVLYVDVSAVEHQRDEFYRAERKRFAHYYTLDKRLGPKEFDAEVTAFLESCQIYIRHESSQLQLKHLEKEVEQLSSLQGPGVAPLPVYELLSQVQELLSQAAASQSLRDIQPIERSVFLSYRFAEEEYINGLTRLLRQAGFEVVTGKRSNTYISRAVLDRIRQCEFFLCLMTKDKQTTEGAFTTSPWLLEEKGAALALGKPIVLMVEEGVSDFGGLQGDWQRIHFKPKGFLTAALEAVEQLRSYVGAR